MPTKTPLLRPDLLSGRERACYESHFGLWHMEDSVFWGLVMANEEGLLEKMEPQKDAMEIIDGIAMISVMGHLTKHGDSFGGGSTIRMRRNLRLALRDESVSAILMVVNSPGGHAEGTWDFANDVNMAKQIKPVHTHVQGLCASAAAWDTLTGSFVTATPDSQIGSFGTIATLIDRSEWKPWDGSKLKVISTGPYKAVGAPGHPITEAQLAVYEENVRDLNNLFMQGIREARGFTQEQVEGLFTGRVWIADKAEQLGLVDGIGTLDEAFHYLKDEVVPSNLFKSFQKKQQVEEPAEQTAETSEDIDLTAIKAEARQAGFDEGYEQGHDAGLEEGFDACVDDITKIMQTIVIANSEMSEPDKSAFRMAFKAIKEGMSADQIRESLSSAAITRTKSHVKLATRPSKTREPKVIETAHAATAEAEDVEEAAMSHLDPAKVYAKRNGNGRAS